MGWIKLDRRLLDHEIWNSEAFSKGQAWIDLLLSAEYETKRTMFGWNKVVLQKGQQVISIRSLSERWQWSKHKVTDYLEYLQNEGMITLKKETFGTLLTIVKYGDFQGCGDVKGTQKGRKRDTSGTEAGHLGDAKGKPTIKERNIRNKEKKNSEVMYFDSPTVDNAFRDYIQMRKEIKAPMTDRAITLAVNQLHKLSGGDPQTMIDIINQSIMNGWKGLFALKETKKTTGTFNAASYLAGQVMQEGLP